jgi:peptide chain release factor
MEKEEKIIQITSGRGPAECCWVVAQLLKAFVGELKDKGFDYEVLHQVKGLENRTISSVVVKVNGKDIRQFMKSWLGTVLWIGQSPFRKFHKRKNWFVGIAEFDKDEAFEWNEKDLCFETFRSSGAGGQHVNKVESAVRAIHIPTGLAIVARDSRSQYQNKKLAMERLKELLEKNKYSDLQLGKQDKWMEHCQLERGNPVRIYKGDKFLLQGGI